MCRTDCLCTSQSNDPRVAFAISVWESQDHCDRFSKQRLHPAVHPLLAEIFGDALAPEPERITLPVVHAWGSALPSSHHR